MQNRIESYEGSREWYAAYLATYLERDVRLANDVGRFSDFQTLVRLIAVRTSQEYNASALARDVGVSSKTVEAWISILEASYLVFRLRSWQANLGKRLVKRPKLFFWDTGLVCHLAGIRDEEALRDGPLGGPVMENLVVAEILKAAAHRGIDLEAHYFRESNGLEADLILNERSGRRRWIVDVKSGHTPKAPWADSLDRVAVLIREARAPSAWKRVVVYRGATRSDWPARGMDFMSLDDALGQWAPRGS